MRAILLATVALASLAIGLPAIHAQQAEDNARKPAAAGASQKSSPVAADRERHGPPPRGEMRSNQAAPSGSDDNNQKRTGENRGISGAPGRSENATIGQAERSRSTEQSGDRSREGRRGAGNRARPQDARDDRGVGMDRSRSRSSTEQSLDRARERSTTGQSSGERASEPRGANDSPRSSRRDRTNERQDARDDRRDSTGRSRTRSSTERSQDRVGERTTTGQSDGQRASEPRRPNDSLQSTRRDRAGQRQDARAGSISLSAEQRTRVSARFASRIDRLNVQPLPRSRLSVSIGRSVPSAIRLYDVSPDIVEIYPGFRGHKFVVVEDEIVIIEPHSRRIVTTIPLEHSRSARAESRSTTGAAPSGDRVRFTPQQRTIIRETVLREPTCRYEQRIEFFLVIPFPTEVRVCEFPERVVMEVPEVRQYRYVTRGDEVLVVDPDEHRVVEVLE